ncbi:NAD(P)-binding protein [Myxozyma melibiosi]|uniref:D-xylose 1-dehydrogenase (NADP(+), D-xylono-1,5-lactone-forming) n=1 Tax=Myxozyma melibiosi TaxID=54550 RepID=A0ABR1FCA5_9ASCO
MVYTAKWGIIATGWITERFVKDLLLDPSTRDVSDVKHEVVAIGSRSLEKAQKFVDEFAPGQTGIRLYGDYESVLSDKDVEIVYIGTPHSHHYKLAIAALRAGKNVLCEKAMTINAAQAKHIAKVAAENNVFVMEAMWTRFFPLMRKVESLLWDEKAIGTIHRVTTDLSNKFAVDPANRIYNPALGGGALLDLGVYAITWVNVVCYNHPENKQSPPTSTKASVLKTPLTGVDEETVIVQVWDKPHIISTATMSIVVDGPTDCMVRIEGSKGQIIVPLSSCRPTKVILRPNEGEEQVFDFPIVGYGMHWEADQVARDVRDGKKVSDIYPIAETLYALSVCDEVRKQNDFVYPAEIEYVEES